MAMGPHERITDITGPPFQQIASGGEPDPIAITIGQVPAETFAGEICPLIEILTRVPIKEVLVNGSPILSMYGLRWSSFVFNVIRRYAHPDKEGRFCFPRMIHLAEGENPVTVTVMDASGRDGTRVARVNKKTRRINQTEERWRMALPIDVTAE